MILRASTPRRPKVPPLAVGETWFIRMPNAIALLTVIIDELTEQTVVLRAEKDSNVSYAGHLGRFVRREIQFIERVPT